MTALKKFHYYLPWREEYNIHRAKIMAELKKMHGAKSAGRECMRVRQAKQYGWSNQPEVICFTSIHNPAYIRTYIQPALDAIWGEWCPNLTIRDW